MKQILIDTINEIQEIKREGGQSPDFATITEIENSIRVEIKETLNALCSDGRLEWHKNVNGIPMFGVKE